MSGNEKKGVEAPGFSEAIVQLEGILRRVEAEEIDIDELAEELGRAAELLELCRGKIRKAEVEVSQIVQALDADDEAEALDAEPDGSDA